MGYREDRLSFRIHQGGQVTGVVLGGDKGTQTVKDEPWSPVEVGEQDRLGGNGLPSDTDDGVVNGHGRHMVAPGNFPL